MNISFIGFGSMAKAIARGLSTSGTYTLAAAAPSLSVGVNKDKIHTHYKNVEVLRHVDIVILAVKPSQMSQVLQEITPHLPSQCLLISIAAGLSLSWLAKHCRGGQAIIRTMPNTPATIGLAATPMIANKETTASQKHSAELIFSVFGLTTWIINEEEMDIYTALSGSGPAYVFLFIESLIDAAVALGIERSIARTFAIQTCKGAVALAEHSDLDLGQLRKQVTSPGGTTAAALDILNERLNNLILTAMTAAKQRSSELGQLY